MKMLCVTKCSNNYYRINTETRNDVYGITKKYIEMIQLHNI